MIHAAIPIVVAIAAAIVCFILVDRAGQPEPIPLILKLAILIIALVFVAHQFGVA